jgi:hypothetical protein
MCDFIDKDVEAGEPATYRVREDCVSGLRATHARHGLDEGSLRRAVVEPADCSRLGKAMGPANYYETAAHPMLLGGD